MPITYWRKACLSRLIRKLIRAVLRRVRESNLPILSDFKVVDELQVGLYLCELLFIGLQLS